MILNSCDEGSDPGKISWDSGILVDEYGRDLILLAVPKNNN